MDIDHFCISVGPKIGPMHAQLVQCPMIGDTPRGDPNYAKANAGKKRKSYDINVLCIFLFIGFDLWTAK